MRAIFDMTDEDPSYPGGRGEMPRPAMIEYSGDDIVIYLGDAEIRMTFGQFDRIREAMNAWIDEIGDPGPLNLETAPR